MHYDRIDIQPQTYSLSTTRVPRRRTSLAWTFIRASISSGATFSAGLFAASSRLTMISYVLSSARGTSCTVSLSFGGIGVADEETLYRAVPAASRSRQSTPLSWDSFNAPSTIAEPIANPGVKPEP